VISGKTLPKEVIDRWPEVFGEINLKVIPLRYLFCVIIKFKDGRVWEIPIQDRLKKTQVESVEEEMAEFFKTYDDQIDQIDFKLDTDKVKKDIQKITTKFLRKRKL